MNTFEVFQNFDTFLEIPLSEKNLGYNYKTVSLSHQKSFEYVVKFYYENK